MRISRLGIIAAIYAGLASQAIADTDTARNYTDTTKPQTTARYFGIERAGKALTDWNVRCLERVYANVAADDSDFKKDDNGFSFAVNTAKLSEEFDIVDPATLQPTGQKATFSQLFSLIMSAYMHEARKRDSAESATPQPETP